MEAATDKSRMVGDADSTSAPARIALTLVFALVATVGILVVVGPTTTGDTFVVETFQVAIAVPVALLAVMFGWLVPRIWTLIVATAVTLPTVAISLLDTSVDEWGTFSGGQNPLPGTPEKLVLCLYGLIFVLVLPLLIGILARRAHSLSQAGGDRDDVKSIVTVMICLVIAVAAAFLAALVV